MLGWDKDENVWLQHATPRLVKKLAGDRVFEEYFKFTVVRNPFSRALSAYRYDRDLQIKQSGSFADYVRELPALVQNLEHSNGSHQLLQSRYVFMDDECVCDFIAHFETLPDSLAPVAARLNIDAALPEHNRYRLRENESPLVATHYDDKITKVILSVYAEDFELFGYGNSPEYLNPQP